jgi:hypothetical protein
MANDGYRKVSGSVFTIVALVHLLRAVRGVPITIGATAAPVWVSCVAVVVAGGLAIWAFRGRG